MFLRVQANVQRFVGELTGPHCVSLIVHKHPFLEIRNMLNEFVRSGEPLGLTRNKTPRQPGSQLPIMERIKFYVNRAVSARNMDDGDECRPSPKPMDHQVVLVLESSQRV